MRDQRRDSNVTIARGHTFGILVGAVDVVAAHDDGWEIEGLLVRVDKHLGGCFAGGIRVGWGKNARLEEIVVLVLDLTVYLVGRDVDEPLDADLLGALQQHVGAIHVGVGEAVGVAKAQVDMRLGGKVEDGVDVVSLQAGDHF